MGAVAASGVVSRRSCSGRRRRSLFPIHVLIGGRGSARAERLLHRLARRAGDDGRRGAHHQLLHLHRVLAGAEHRQGLGDRPRDEHHRRPRRSASTPRRCRWASSASPSSSASTLAGLYGIAVAVMSMLSMAGIIISLDAFGPITDNAGGIAVMSDLPKEVRAHHRRTRRRGQHHEGRHQRLRHRLRRPGGAGALRLVRRGTASPFYALSRAPDGALEFSLKDPKVIIGLFIGGLLPFIFTAFSMDAVGKAAGAVVRGSAPPAASSSPASSKARTPPTTAPAWISSPRPRCAR